MCPLLSCIFFSIVTSVVGQKFRKTSGNGQLPKRTKKWFLLFWKWFPVTKNLHDWQWNWETPVFSESQNASPLDAEPETDFNAKWLFKVIHFGVSEQPLRGYIVQYNNCGLRCEGSEDIAGEISENRHFRWPHSHLKPPRHWTPVPHKPYFTRNCDPWAIFLSLIVMNQIFPETRMFGHSDGEEIMTLAFFVLI